MQESSTHFPTDTTGLPLARPHETHALADGDRFDLRIAPVAKRIGDATVRMLAYNGSVPGPTLRVRQGTKLVVEVANDGDLEATVHWHGLRLDNRHDGTHLTQRPIEVGGRHTYVLDFPDAGAYWYHPHIREDYGQELGLYGSIVVEPAEPGYWPPVHRELTLTLDDVLIEDGKIAPFRREGPTHAAMGRFGNVMLVNGEPEASFTARRGEVVRFYLTNTANTRIFDVALPGARMKLVGGDSGRCEREEFVEQVLIAPSERVVVDVRFERPGALTLEHRTPEKTYPLAAITVTDEAAPEVASRYENLRTNADLAAERARIARYLDAPPDKTLAFLAEMDLGEPELPAGTELVYSCPMHPDVSRPTPGRCPKCWMKLVATAAAPAEFACPMHPDVRSDRPGRCRKCLMKLVPAKLVKDKASGKDHAGHGGHGHGSDRRHDAHGAGAHGHEAHDPHAEAGHAPGGIEWEDDMVEVNRMTTPSNMRWKMVDRSTGAEGMAVDWRFRVGDKVKLRLVNETESDHPMPHPFHVHGAGRFLVLARDGVAEPNLAWKDTVLVMTGQTLDLLLDVTHAGEWMAHCHIAEHHESGMMIHFRVDP